MKKVVILTGKSGDLCNRLFRFARFYCAKPRGVLLLDITFYQFAYLFSPKSFLWKSFFLLLRLLDNKRFAGLVRILQSLPGIQKADPTRLGSETSNRTLSRFYEYVLEATSRVILVEENTFYLVADHENEEAAAALKKIFNLKKKYTKECARLFQQCDTTRITVGVHLRRRDYRTFAGGRYFFDNQQYRGFLSQLQSANPYPGKLEFLLVCEEPLEIADFRPLEVKCFGPSSIGVDQALLSACNFIVGPPSTFSGWAAFLHRIPRAEIQSRNQSISWADFKETSCNYISI